MLLNSETPNLQPSQAKNLIAVSRVAHLDRRALDAGRDRLLLLEHDALLRLRQLVEGTAVAAQEVLELGLRDVGVGEHAARDALLQREHDELRDERLREDARGGLALLGGLLVLDGVRSRVASAAWLLVSFFLLSWVGTDKKNLELPLMAALRRASRSRGFFGMGLQKAKGSQQASASVR